MQILIGFLFALEILVCLLLAGVILLQKPRDGGLGVSFGGGMGEALFGAQMGNVLVNTTIILGAVFLLNTLILSRLTSHTSSSVMDGVRTSPPATPQHQQALPFPADEPAAQPAAASQPVLPAAE